MFVLNTQFDLCYWSSCEVLDMENEGYLYLHFPDQFYEPDSLLAVKWME